MWVLMLPLLAMSSFSIPKVTSLSPSAKPSASESTSSTPPEMPNFFNHIHPQISKTLNNTFDPQILSALNLKPYQIILDSLDHHTSTTYSPTITTIVKEE
ncbi:hypothetical protein V6N13_098462 [Hibiscus sabdariffa]